MITTNALANVEWLFDKAIRENQGGLANGSCVVTRTPQDTPQADEKQRHLIVLNISSYVFRIVALFDFSTDAATRAYLAQHLRIANGELDGQALADVYAEYVNMVCGSVNRELCEVFRHGGMSTPFVLESSCARYIPALNATEVLAFDVEIDEAIRFRCAVCLCVDKETTLDFHIERTRQVEETSGELELF